MKKYLGLAATLVLTIITSCSTVTLQPQTTSSPTVITSPSASAVATSTKAHFTYEGEEGPEHWGDLSSDYSLCKTGKSQTPINLDSSKSLKEELTPIEFNYNAVPLKLINNGHTIQVNYPTGSSVKVNGKVYNLLQFHFHTPSEHKIDNSGTEMELHLVHKSDDGQLLVVGILIKKGAKNTVLQPIWDNFPTKEAVESSIENIKINATDLLPSDKKYFNYSGSLTTPPCSEGVNWFVLKNNIEVSEAQIKAFTDINKLSARPIQPTNDRVIKEAK